MGADKGYDARNFVDPCRALGFTPHVAARKYSRIDAPTTRHAGYEISQRKRKRVEEPFGRMKSYGYTRQTAPQRSGICRLAVSIDRHGLQHYPIEEFGGTKRVCRDGNEQAIRRKKRFKSTRSRNPYLDRKFTQIVLTTIHHLILQSWMQWIAKSAPISQFLNRRLVLTPNTANLQRAATAAPSEQCGLKETR